MILEKQNILIISNEGWGDTWYSKHNYAWELSKNNTVYFINPPDKFNPFNIFRKNITECKIANNLYAITYKNILPVRLEFLRKLNEKYIFNKLNSFLKRKNIDAPIFWSFDPIRLTSPETLNPKKIILHMVDKYRFTYPAETIIAKKANLILCVAKDIAEGFIHLNSNIKVVPHAIAEEEFSSSSPKLIKTTSIMGVYVGNIDLRMDFEITSYILKRFPEIKFHFIGKIIDSHFTNAPLELFSGNYPNAIYHGEKPFKELKDYIANADFCFLFKDVKFPGNNISSHKMLQYFAQGKPIFSTKLSKYEEHDYLLFMRNDKEQLGDLIENFIKNGDDSSQINRRINYAKAHTFEITIKKIEALLN